MNQKIVVITGMDATGKSSVIRNLSEITSTVSEIWDLLKTGEAYLPFQSKSEIDQFLCWLTPNSRLLFLAHALRYSIDSALKSNAEVVLVNAYYFKYFASELALGASPSLVQKLAEEFPSPDLVIRLNVTVNIAVDRKSKYSRYECGCADISTREAFVAHQNLVLSQWDSFDQNGWHDIDTQRSVEETTDEVLAIIKGS